MIRLTGIGEQGEPYFILRVLSFPYLIHSTQSELLPVALHFEHAMGFLIFMLQFIFLFQRYPCQDPVEAAGCELSAGVGQIYT